MALFPDLFVLLRVLDMFVAVLVWVGCVGFLLRALICVLVGLTCCVFCFLVYCVIWYFSVCVCGSIGDLALVWVGCGGLLAGCGAGWRCFVFWDYGHYVFLWAGVI